MEKSNIFDSARDMASLIGLLPERNKRIKSASDAPAPFDHVRDLASKLHPRRLELVISSVNYETPTTKSFIMKSADGAAELPFFRAGQYLSLRSEVRGVSISRPYSISSSPNDAVDGGFYQITINKKDGGFFTQHVWEEWEVGTKLTSSGPCGFFYYDDLRDSNEIIALAGGSGITPFRAMAKDIIENDLDVKMTLLYGIRLADEIIFDRELQELAKQAPEKLSVHLVCSEPDEKWCGPTGFMSANCIRELAGDITGKTFFICGPQAMYEFLKKELATFNLQHKHIRREVFGEIGDVTVFDSFPKELADKTFDLTVNIAGRKHTIPAKATETVLVAMERASLAPPSQCRSGECGVCNSLLMSGDVFISPENDGRRLAHKKFGFFHPCSSYPVSDMEIKVMRS